MGSPRNVKQKRRCLPTCPRNTPPHLYSTERLSACHSWSGPTTPSLARGRRVTISCYLASTATGGKRETDHCLEVRGAGGDQPLCLVPRQPPVTLRLAA